VGEKGGSQILKRIKTQRLIIIVQGGGGKDHDWALWLLEGEKWQPFEGSMGR